MRFWPEIISLIIAIGAVALTLRWGRAEMVTPADKQARLNSVFDFLKYVLGTVALGVLTAILSQTIKDRETIIKEIEQIGKYINNAVDPDRDKRIRFASLFAHVTRDSESRALWVDYEDWIVKEVEREEAIKERTNQVVANLQNRTITPEEGTQELAKLATEQKTIEAKIGPAIKPFSEKEQMTPRTVLGIPHAEFGAANDGELTTMELFAVRFHGDNNQVYAFLRDRLAKLGLPLHTSPGFIDIVGVRKAQLSDLYDDEIFVLWTDAKGAHAEGFRATCDPGQYFIDHPLNPRGCAQFVDGRYTFQLGPSAKGETVLRQKGPVVVSRRSNGVYEGDEQGDFGFLISYGGTDEHVGVWSSGSQLIFGGKEGKEWARFRQIIQHAPPDQKTFRYTLLSITRSDVHE